MTTGADATVPALEVDGARKRFGTVEALAGATFAVRPGELLGLLGPNGAGKTTLIKAVAGRLALDAGTIRLFGRPRAREDARPEIGVVPQELALYPLLTATENLEVFGALYGVSPRDLAARTRWALEWCDLADRAREPTKRFSGGMKRRLNIACGLLHRPSIVLLDEPTVGVDPQSRERIYEMLADLRRDGISIVLTTHHLEEAERRCDRIVILDRGRTVAAGTLDELVRTSVTAGRSLRVTLGAPWPADREVPAGTTIDASRSVVTGVVEDPGRDVAALLERIAHAGRPVVDLQLTGATLQDVFIALTGRELRE